MAITPSNSLLTALSGLGIDATRPRPAPEAARPAAPPQPASKPVSQAVSQPAPQRAAAPDPSRPLPRGSIVNIVV
ncbi:MAG: hypothetical protein ACM30I_13295 [Gemmatimonas sp.]